MTLDKDSEVWCQSLQAAALAFRLGMEGKGCEALATFAGAALPLVEGGAAMQLQFSLAEALSAQTRRDFMRLADCLEYEIQPLLIQAENNLPQHQWKDGWG